MTQEMLQTPCTPKHNITRVDNTLPFNGPRFGSKPKFQFPPQNTNSESPCKSHFEMMRSQQLLANQLDSKYKSKDGLRLSPHISIPLIRTEDGDIEDDDYDFNGDVEDELESCEDDSVASSILSSLSDIESPTPSSSPVFDDTSFRNALKPNAMKNVVDPATVAMFTLPLPTKIKFKPNKALKPVASILKRTAGLNFIMNSLNGNYKDATIFATEVNSYLSENVPYPTCTIERVTIPVNSEIKRKYKQDRNEMLGGYYNSSDEDQDNLVYERNDDTNEQNSKQANDKASSDAAVIRAYDFNFEDSTILNKSDRVTTHLGIYSQNQLMSRKQTPSTAKKVRWCEFLEW